MMRRPVLLSVLILLMLAVPASAQSSSPLADDSRALLFRLGPNFDLSTIRGANLSLKTHRSATRAQRLGLSVSAMAHTTSGRNSDTQRVGVDVSYVFIRYHESRTGILPYSGLGPVVGFSLSRDELPDEWHTQFTLNAGVSGMLGVEWFVTDAISIMGEYSTILGLNYNRAPGGDESLKQYVIRLLPQGVTAGVSVYF